MSIQRWRAISDFGPAYMTKESEGRYVLHADHVAALLTQDGQHGEQSHAHYMDGYAAALDAAREAVAALPDDGWMPTVLAKIKGLRGES